MLGLERNNLVTARAGLGLGVAASTFAGLGTVAALWENPLFTRMTPTGGFEIATLLLLSALAGGYVGLPQAGCGTRTAGLGGVFGFLGIACPLCNKILLLVFGGALLLQYYEPARPYLALGGIVLLSGAIWSKVSRRRPCAETAKPVADLTSR